MKNILLIQSDATNYCIWTNWTRRFVRIAKLLQRRWAHVVDVGSRSQKDARQKSQWVTSDTPRSELGKFFSPYKLWRNWPHGSMLCITLSVYIQRYFHINSDATMYIHVVLIFSVGLGTDNNLVFSYQFEETDHKVLGYVFQYLHRSRKWKLE